MTTFRPRLWTSLSAAAVLSAGIVGCGGEGGEKAATPPDGVTASTGGEGQGGEGEGGEAAAPAASGEAGAQEAYTAVPAGSRAALRLAHLKGFILAAQAIAPTEGAEAASALVGQGMLEVYDPAAAEYAALGVNTAALRNAASSGTAGELSAALATLNQAGAKAGGEPAEVVKAMTNIAAGLYQGVVAGGAVDTVEYQHAYGAALSAPGDGGASRPDRRPAGARSPGEAVALAHRAGGRREARHRGRGPRPGVAIELAL
jgi:hypothetical protein